MNYYERLDVPSNATYDEIKSAYHRKCDVVHPDKHAGRGDPVVDAEATKEQKQLNEAWATLQDPEARKRYDAKLAKDGETSTRPAFALEPPSVDFGRLSAGGAPVIATVTAYASDKASLRQISKPMPPHGEFWRLVKYEVPQDDPEAVVRFTFEGAVPSGVSAGRRTEAPQVRFNDTAMHLILRCEVIASASAAASTPSTPSSAPKSSYAPPVRSSPSSLRRRRRGVKVFATLLLIVAVVVAGLIVFLNNRSKLFPPRPTAATNAVILAPVVAALQNCARAAVLDPANCPQSDSASGTAVIWGLHGDPTSGAIVTYNGDGSTFTVSGHGVMSVRYSGGHDTVTFGYRATVRYANGVAELENPLSPLTDSSLDAQISVPEPNLTDAQLGAAVKAALLACREGICPVSDANYNCAIFTIVNPTSVSWSLGSDPLLNAAYNYDIRYGIFHVVGSYVLVATLGCPGSTPTDRHSGNYDAWVTLDGTHVTVIQIKDVAGP